MFGYRRYSFKRAMTLLSTLRASPDDFDTLLCLQESLISEIILAEARIRLAKNESRVVSRKRSEYCNTRVKSFQQSIYYWKAIGDAIAFLYLDRFALKHVHYSTNSFKVKQSPGFISGSIGFRNEIEVARDFIAAGCPCLLTDLTNTIRHGDICILVGPDPKLIEVKSSKVKNRRIKRQIRDLAKISEFYRTDRSDNLRGDTSVFRVSTQSECTVFSNEFNQCIHFAYDNGYCHISPEEGVHYIAIADLHQPVSTILERFRVNGAWCFVLNSFKSNRSWAPYYPFTLLIESERALYDFILGRLCIIVLLDPEVMRQTVIEMGYVPEIDLDSEYPIRTKKSSAEAESRLSVHILRRAALEAMSLRWILRSWLQGFERDQQLAKNFDR